MIQNYKPHYIRLPTIASRSQAPTAAPARSTQG